MTSHPQRFRAAPTPSVAGRVTVPGDKSISHRSLMLGAIAQGRSVVRGFLRGDDCLATQAALEALGVPIRTASDGTIEVDGVGMHGLKAPARVLDLGNSGTAIRLMTGLLAGQPFAAELTGDASLRSRPMERVAAPLRSMGARVDTSAGKPPVRTLGVASGAALRGIDYSLPVASAQIKSALLLAGLYARGKTTLRSPGPSRDHTERMLETMGVAVEQEAATNTVSLVGPVRSLRAVDFDVPADFSSAAFFIVAGCLGAAQELVITNVGINPTRTGLLAILERMGARFELVNRRSVGAEPVADIRVTKSALRGIDVPVELVPLAIDEFPILFIAAAAAQGTTTVRGAEELRAKETDRLAVMSAGLRAVGVAVQDLADGLVVHGGAALNGGRVDARGDHRVAMSFSVASLLAQGPIEIDGTAEVATSFPGFLETARAAGLRVEAAP